ncbi:MAG: pyridoxamine 5'-phosphate oxidase family protein [Chitinophagaceae bacterium]
MNDKIIEFIAKQTCGNLCCVDKKGNPWCFSFFYSYDENEVLLHYKSSEETRHTPIINANPAVAGTILPDKLNLLQIKGIQFEGIVLPFDHPLAKHASSHYYKKHPVGIAMPGEIWTIRVNNIKFTDNTLGFGKKLLWER